MEVGGKMGACEEVKKEMKRGRSLRSGGSWALRI